MKKSKMMTSLKHNGIYVPPYEYKSFSIKICNHSIKLSPKTEEMAISLIKRELSPTATVLDRLAYQNFMKDFIGEIRTENPSHRFLEDWYIKYAKEIDKGEIQWLTHGKPEKYMEIDFFEIVSYLKEAKRKALMTKEEKKESTKDRKAKRETFKEKYGYAILDERKIEIANWTAEPSCIFIGRGEHPKRGSWKEGPKEEDIILNLSPDAPIPRSILEIPNFREEEIFLKKKLLSYLKESEVNRLCHIEIQLKRENVPKKDIEELKQIQNFMKNGKRTIVELVENIIQNIKKKDLNTRENGEKITKELFENIRRNIIEDITTHIYQKNEKEDGNHKVEQNIKPLSNLEENVLCAKTLIFEFSTFITEILLTDTLSKIWEKEAKIGETQNLERIWKSCVQTVIEFFILLNISLNMPWKSVTWEPNKLWIASWTDKLNSKQKYVWFSDSAFIKQEREKLKFTKAQQLNSKINKIQDFIMVNLGNVDPDIRKISTVCWLIFTLNLRVGDEKDPDEADTVGAITLRPEHISINGNKISFDFLGKDSVRWIKETTAPKIVIENLKMYSKICKEYLFEGVDSRKVSKFLSTKMEGLTAKVFRTWKCTEKVKYYLDHCGVTKEDLDEVKKYHAKMGNLEGAKVCNHKRKVPLTFDRCLERKEDKLKMDEDKLKELIKQGKKTDAILRKIQRSKLDIELTKETKEYALGTSLKSYIDPSIYVRWAIKVDYSLEKIYPKTLQKKFEWAFNEST